MDLFKVQDGKVELIKNKVITREYHDFEHTVYTDHTDFFTDDEFDGWYNRSVLKHKRYELISREDIDTTGYSWIDGIDVSGFADPAVAVNEMLKYNSLAEYRAALPENQSLYQLDIDYRISKLELGI